MTLYKKWDIGKNLTFVGSVLMLIFIFVRWINLRGTSMSDFRSYVESVRTLIHEWGVRDSDANAIVRAYDVNAIRWLLMLPMVYPVYTLFTEKYCRSIARISALTACVAGLLFAILGAENFNAIPWLFFAFSLVSFAGTCMSKSVRSETPDFMDSGVQPCEYTAGEARFCAQCGSRTEPGANFCTNCGAALK